MATYRDPAFQDRLALAAQAKQKALDKLKAKAPIDPAVLAERKATAEAKAAAEAEKRAAKLAEKKAAQEAAAAEKAAKREAELAARPVVKEKVQLTPEEQKAIRDAKYAARKARK